LGVGGGEGGGIVYVFLLLSVGIGGGLHVLTMFYLMVEG
jgi:hypothetical protein